MVKKRSKKEIEKEINHFFSNISNKTPKEIKKIKRLAMSKNVPLGEYRKYFCKKCFNVFKMPKIKIKNKMKIIVCENCGYVSRWKIVK
jgi:RNase P subunit RPR2